MQIGEALRAEQQVTDDEQRPPLANEVEGVRRGAAVSKPVGFVSYGGKAGGLRAVEQLRQVYAELHAITVRDTVSFHNYWELFDSAGDLLDAVRPSAAAKTMLDQLVWWAQALRTARAARPYAA